MGWGDEILAAGQAEVWWRQHGQTSVIVDVHGRPRRHPIWDGNPCITQPQTRIPPGEHTIVNGPHCRPYIVYPFTAESGWTFNRDFHARDHVARIYLTADEKALGHDLHKRVGDYVLIEPWSKHPNLRWPRAYWQALVESRPDITFVQHIHAGTDFYLDGVQLVTTPTFRAACGALEYARAYIRGESGMLHAAAALGIPAVAIWGACMDWDVLGGYSTHVGVGVSLAPCGSYLPCLHCARAMDDIQPRNVSAALDHALVLPRGRNGLR
jgi:ribosomal protein S18 acetylase RimI-like enzyme